MSIFETIRNRYIDVDFDNVTKKDVEALRRDLQKVTTEEIVTLQDHKDFVTIVRKFRNYIAETTGLNGQNFSKTLASLLSVGADGIYTKDLRFIFELIQNVDDCTYNDPADCKLDMNFDFNEGIITLLYNEVGFRPFDVFSITGIAEAAKNISPEKIEIGEKGIGFKSVFGVAEKVLIQSGKFSFMLYEDNFTVPELHYNNFEGVSGTKLTLYLKKRSSAAREIYSKLIDEYSKEDSLFNKNPILFLNKLTSIRMYYDAFDSLEFKVSKGSKDVRYIGNVMCEDNIEVSSVFSKRHVTDNKKTSIICTRYTMPVTYTKAMCQSRYGQDTAFPKKEMNMQIVIPNPESVKQAGNGALYSFLPTQVRTNVPVACHIPFKLDASREFIDNQGKNLWFKHSCDEFSNLLEKAYLDFSRKVKENAITYIPYRNQYFFDVNTGNDNVLALKVNGFSGEKLTKLALFYTSKGEYCSADEIYSIDIINTIDNSKEIDKLLKSDKALFIPPKDNVKSLSAFGIIVLKEIYCTLFKRGLEDISILKDVLDIIDNTSIHYRDLLLEVRPKGISLAAVEEISKHTYCLNAFNELASDRISKYKAIEFSIKDNIETKDVRCIISKDEKIEESDFDKLSAKYFNSIGFEYVVANIDKSQGYFIADNVLVLSAIDALASLSEFCRKIGNSNLLSANLKMRSASIKLNEADDSLSIPEYMSLLHDIRNSIKLAFGQKQYEAYTKVIRELNADEYSFIRELIQNADDCEYPSDEIPSFKMRIDGKNIDTEYNEKGFTKANVRSITAIGESTKKKLKEGTIEIGEKGIGFKTVFCKAESVDIHSNDFHFRLTDTKPTIPELLSNKEQTPGTKMSMKLRDKISGNRPRDDELFSLCLCLRNLKSIKINNNELFIEDTEEKRIVKLNNKEFVFDKFTYAFKISEQQALINRNLGGKNISENQEITIYIPEKPTPKNKYYLYCGLPTAIEFNVPIIIDAPFELTASRDGIIQNKWNIIVREHMYKAYADMLEFMAPKKREKIATYIRYSTLFHHENELDLFKNGDGWLKDFDINPILRTKHIIPTYNRNVFATPFSLTVKQLPEFLHRAMVGNVEEDDETTIVDDKNNKYVAVFDKLGCKMVQPTEIARLICRYEDELAYIPENRNAMYEYLCLQENKTGSQAHILCNAHILPIKPYGVGEGSQFIACSNVKIYNDTNAKYSSAEYPLLDTSLLEKQKANMIFNIDIQELDEDYKEFLYKERIKNMILRGGYSNDKIYSMLLKEVATNYNQLKKNAGVLWENKEHIPLLMSDGTYKKGRVFINKHDEGLFCGAIIQSVLADIKSNKLAEIMEYPLIDTVTYDDLSIYSMISEEDVMDFHCEELKNGYYILRQCIRDGYVSKELIEEYDLDGVTQIDFSEEYDEDDFPTEKVKNKASLISKIRNDSVKVRKIVKVQELRTVSKIQLDARTVSMDEKNIRNNTLDRYRPSQNTDACFCQMCLKRLSSEYLNTNSIFVEPKYYWPQSRVALCFDCSKKFVLLRKNEKMIEQFHNQIIDANVDGDEAIPIKIGDAEIHFTQTHVAELQEIIKTKKY